MIPNTGLSGTVDITSTKGLDGTQGATNNLEFDVNPMANIQPATHVSRFKMLNALNVVHIPVLPCVMFCRLSTPNNQNGDNSVRTSAWVFVVPCQLHVRVPPLECPWNFRMGDSTWRNVFPEGDRQHERTQAEEWSVVGILLPLVSSSSVTVRKPIQNIYTCILHGQTACIRLLIAGHCSQQELIAVYALWRTAGFVILHEYVEDWTHRLRFNYHYIRNSYKLQTCTHDTRT
jgi:hypothetical protein